MWNSTGSNNWDDNWGSQRTIGDCKRRIHTLEHKIESLTIAEIKELADLKEAMYEYRKKCNHYWDKVPLFMAVRKICTVCGEEDRSYDYATDKERDRPKI